MTKYYKTLFFALIFIRNHEISLKTIKPYQKSSTFIRKSLVFIAKSLIRIRRSLHSKSHNVPAVEAYFSYWPRLPISQHWQVANDSRCGKWQVTFTV